MYSSFFGFNKLPFRLRPDLAFLYAGEDYKRTRTHIIHSLQGRQALTLLSGPPGVGKTTLVEDVLIAVSKDFTVCRINQPQLSGREILHAILLQIGAISDVETGSIDQLKVLLSTWVTGDATHHGKILVVLDDAQLMSQETFRDLSILLRSEPQVRQLLVGRGITLAMPDKEEIPLKPFSMIETQAYIEWRLKVSGSNSREIFTPDAFNTVFQNTAGVPRLINALCDAALQAAYARSSTQIGHLDITAATQDSRWAAAIERDRDNSVKPSVWSPSFAQILVTHGRVRVGSWPLTLGVFTIGRAPDNELSLDSLPVSRHHCRIITTDQESTIEDLESTNGISVNGQLVAKHILTHDDHVQVGDYFLLYQEK